MATETTDVVIDRELQARDDGSARLPRVSWGGIFAGLIAALVTHLALSLLGLAIGFATFGGEAAPHARGFLTGSAVWLGASLAISAFVGGLTAVRSARYLSSRHGRLNGFITGALFSLVMLVLAVNAVTSITRTALGVASTTLQTAAGAAGSAVGAVGGGLGRAGGLEGAFAQLGLGEEFNTFVAGLNREELAQFIAERHPELNQRQVDAAAGVVLSTLRNAGAQVQANLGDINQLPQVVRDQITRVRQAFQEPAFQQRLQARGLTEQQAAEVTQVLRKEVDQLQASVNQQLAAWQARADELRQQAAETATATAWISLLILGLMLGLSTLGGAVGSGYKLGESILREKPTIRERFGTRRPVTP